MQRVKRMPYLQKWKLKPKVFTKYLTKQAEGYEQVVKAAGGDPSKAFQLLLLEKLPELVKTQVEAVKNIKIDKITVWDSGAGSSDNGNGATANFVSGMMKSVPPLNDLFNMAGLNLPTYLKGADDKDAPSVDVTDDKK
jgi:flotillin